MRRSSTATSGASALIRSSASAPSRHVADELEVVGALDRRRETVDVDRVVVGDQDSGWRPRLKGRASGLCAAAAHDDNAAADVQPFACRGTAALHRWRRASSRSTRRCSRRCSSSPAMTSEASAWKPVSLVIALTVVMVLADVAVVWARRLRSVGRPARADDDHGAARAGTGCRDRRGLDLRHRCGDLPGRAHQDASGTSRSWRCSVSRAGSCSRRSAARSGSAPRTRSTRRSCCRSTCFSRPRTSSWPSSGTRTSSRRTGAGRSRSPGCPALPLELVNAVLAATAVLLWTQGGVDAAVGLLAVLVVVIPLTRSAMDGLRSSDDLVELRAVSDARADEVARLAADRERLLEEVLETEERERARLAESLHDGPMQRLIALRQDAAEPAATPTAAMLAGIDEAIAETRAVISSLHPATSRELGLRRVAPSGDRPVPGLAVRRADRAQHGRRPDARRRAAAPDRPGAHRQRGQARPAEPHRRTRHQGRRPDRARGQRRRRRDRLVGRRPRGTGRPRRPRDGPPARGGRRRPVRDRDASRRRDTLDASCCRSADPA